MPPRPKRHDVTVVCEGQQIGGWESYHIDTSMIVPADSFHMRRPFSQAAWLTLRRDARVIVRIDGTIVLDGTVEHRHKNSRDAFMEISGRCKVGRGLMKESAPSIAYDALRITDAVKRLMDPWYPKLSLSDTRNRNLRRGKGRRIPAEDETIVVNIKAVRSGKVHPGMSKMQVIQEIASSAGLVVFGSADGKELIMCKPNYRQAAQYLICHTRKGSKRSATCVELDMVEDDGDRYSLIQVAGVGQGDEDSYGADVVDVQGRAVDNPFNTTDGTGRDFLRPARMLMPERNYEGYGDAQRVADREMARRNFRRNLITAKMPWHGQWLDPANPTLFAPNTIARVIDEDFDPELDDEYLIVSCAFESTRDNGEETHLELVPKGTEIIL